jgi:hypothetical protein
VANLGFVKAAPVKASEAAAGLKSTELSYLNGAVNLPSATVFSRPSKSRF